MNTRRWRNVIVGVVLTAAILVGGWLLLVRLYTTSDATQVARLDNLPFNGILQVRVDGEGSGSPVFDGDREWMVQVVEVVYDRGPYASVAAGGATVTQPLPGPGDRVRVSVPADLALDAGEDYYMLVVRARFDDPVEQAAWPWQASVVLDRSGAPVPGTTPELAADLEAITLPGETPLDALRAFAVEQARALDARVAEGVEVAGERLALLHPVTPTGDPVADFMARAPEERQLPGMLVDAPPGLDTALGIDRWAPWRIIVRYDQAAATEHQWIGVFVDGAGFLGPTELAPDQEITEIDGFGPADATLGSLMLWGRGTPAEILPAGASVPDAVRARHVPVTPVEVSGDLRDILDQGGAVLVDLRDGRFDLGVLTNDEARKLVVSLVPAVSSGSESKEGS